MDFSLKFIYFERERERKNMSGGGAESEGEGKSPAGSLLSAQSWTPDSNL